MLRDLSQLKNLWRQIELIKNLSWLSTEQQQYPYKNAFAICNCIADTKIEIKHYYTSEALIKWDTTDEKNKTLNNLD